LVSSSSPRLRLVGSSGPDGRGYAADIGYCTWLIMKKPKATFRNGRTACAWLLECKYWRCIRDISASGRRRSCRPLPCFERCVRQVNSLDLDLPAAAFVSLAFQIWRGFAQAKEGGAIPGRPWRALPRPFYFGACCGRGWPLCEFRRISPCGTPHSAPDNRVATVPWLSEMLFVDFRLFWLTPPGILLGVSRQGSAWLKAITEFSGRRQPRTGEQTWPGQFGSGCYAGVYPWALLPR